MSEFGQHGFVIESQNYISGINVYVTCIYNILLLQRINSDVSVQVTSGSFISPRVPAQQQAAVSRRREHRA